jgi:hypothetical protein
MNSNSDPESKKKVSEWIRIRYTEKVCRNLHGRGQMMWYRYLSSDPDQFGTDPNLDPPFHLYATLNLDLDPDPAV